MVYRNKQSYGYGPVRIIVPGLGVLANMFNPNMAIWDTKRDCFAEIYLHDN